MNKCKRIGATAMLGCAVLMLGSCQAMLESMWTPRTPLQGEQKMQIPATVVSTSRGLTLQKTGSIHIASTFCKFCSDAGKTYRGDLMPILMCQPSNGRSFTEATTELPYRKGQKGILTVGSQSGVVHSFMPYEHMGKMENNRRAWEMRAAEVQPSQEGF